ncbi:MAG: sodium solute transporter [Bacteroidetes bacterium]|nr:sodium solute transporter [Bacteroidota bacterium]
MKQFSTIDWIVFIGYVIIIVFVGLWVSRKKKGEQRTSQDYFLAGRSLPWWAIGATLIAANISAEHFIAMSGSGYAIGLAIAAYEWIAAVTLIFVAKYFLPVFIEKGIFTMPQFLTQRYDKSVSTCFAVFWILVYIFVNMTAVIYLGALAMERIIGIPLIYGIIGFSTFSALYSLWGGMKAVAWTDVINVCVLIFGGLVTTAFALNAISDGNGVIAGFGELLHKAPQKFHMIIEKGTLFAPDGKGGLKDAFSDLPGLGVVLGSMWLTNLSFWGFNQFIIQRGLAGKTLKEAQLGVVFAGYMKLLIPLLVVIPGIAVFALGAKLGKSDEAYPWLIRNIVPVGVTGLSFAAIAAAAVSALSSIVNSTSTIFTIDIYKGFINKNATEKQMVRVGMITALVALMISTSIAPRLQTLDQAYQYIQEYTGFIYPGEFLIFFCGLFWRQASTRAALFTAILTIPLGILFKIIFPGMPFILRIGYVFILLSFVMVGLSLMNKSQNINNVLDKERGKKGINTGIKIVAIALLVGIVAGFFVSPLKNLALEAIFVPVMMFILIGLILILNNKQKKMNIKAILIEKGLFNTSMTFNIAAIGICGILAVLYYIFW